MTELVYLTRRNLKIFFKDKGIFFFSLITPVILLVLYATFLANVFKDSFVSNIPEGFSAGERLINATVGGELVSSIFAVSCITVSFCSNLLMVKDRVNGAIRDLSVTPVKPSVLALSYFWGSLAATLLVCYFALIACFIYLAVVGWCLSFADVALIIADIFLLALFGTVLSSIINMPLKTDGQSTAVGTIVSAGYGFICGAYMPLSSFSQGLRDALGFLPGTYGTSVIRNACLAGAFREMSAQGFPAEVIEGIKDGVDCNLYFFGNQVGIGVMYAVLCGSIAVLLGLYILLNALKKRAR